MHPSKVADPVSVILSMPAKVVSLALSAAPPVTDPVIAAPTFRRPDHAVGGWMVHCTLVPKLKLKAVASLVPPHPVAPHNTSTTLITHKYRGSQ